MTVDPCAAGHPSATDGFCDMCGKRITDPAAEQTSTSAISATPSAHADSASATAGGGPACPNCLTPMTGTGRFCEACGYDTKTGKVPQAAPATTPAAPAGVWTATVTADRKFFDTNDFEDVEFPPQYPPRQFTLTGPQMRIGRASVSKGIHPEIDLSAAPLDPGVSHCHALLTLNTAGVWLLSDLGSTNGTFVNDKSNPITVGTLVELHDGDRIHLGAWTAITVHAPATAS